MLTIDGQQTVAELLDQRGFVVDGQRQRPFVVAVDGEYLLQQDWDRPVGAGLVTILPLPPHLQGGGGGSNPLRIVLQVAMIYASYQLGGLVGDAMSLWSPVSAGTYAAMATAGAMIVGSMLLNALLPLPGLSTGSQQKAADAYLIGPQGNTARLRDPVPVLYGCRRIYPDLAAAPWTEYSGNEMYLYQLMTLTAGKMQILDPARDIQIEDTPIGNFSEVEWRIIQPGEYFANWPDNVYTAPEVQDLKLPDPDEDQPEIVVGHEGYISQKGSPGSENTPATPDVWSWREVKRRVKFQTTIVVVPQGQQSSRIAIDLSMPRGFGRVENDWVSAVSVGYIVQARAIDGSNNPAGDWINLVPVSGQPASDPTRYGFHSAYPVLSGSTIDPQFRTIEFSVPQGRYEIRVGRTSAESEDQRTMDAVHWVGARSYMAQHGNYGDVTMLAVKIRATQNINNSVARRISVLGTRILPVWDGTSWTEQPTRSIAWAAADAMRNRLYGRGLADKYVNLQELLRLDAVWEGRGDYCDAHITEAMTLWDALTGILACGRAVPIYYAGMIDICRNEPRPLTQMFTPQNMRQDTFAVKYAFRKADDPDFVIVEYTDPVTWTLKEVECALPDSQKLRGSKVAMPWITSRAQAWREGIHKAAMHRYQRQFPAWGTEMEGMIPRFGDRLLAEHDVLNADASGVIESLTGDVLTTSEPMPWRDGVSHQIVLRSRTGSVQGRYPISRIDERSGRIAGLLPQVTDGWSEEPTHYIFGTTERCGVEVVMLSVAPEGRDKFVLSTVNYSDIPHTIENDMAMPPEGTSSGVALENLTLYWLHVDPTLTQELFQLSVNTARGATSYQFEVSEDDGATWTALASSGSTSIVTALPMDVPIKIRARAMGTIPGDWLYWSGTVDSVPPVDYIAPTMTVTVAGGQVADGYKSFRVAITAPALDELVSYNIEENGIVVSSVVLDPGQTFEITRSFQRQPSGTAGEYQDSGLVTFRAYGYDASRRKSAIAEQSYTY